MMVLYLLCHGSCHDGDTQQHSTAELMPGTRLGTGPGTGDSRINAKWKM